MLITAKPKNSFNSLCSVLERNGIDYEICSSDCVICSVCSRDRDIRMIFSIDSSKMLITLWSSLYRNVPYEKTTDAALALCMINHSIPDGELCFDIGEHLIYYKLTSSFYNSGISDSVFEYMLSAGANTIEKYRPAIKNLICSELRDIFPE